MTELLDELGRSEMHYAAADGNSAALSQLVAAGGDVNLQDRNHWTPLHFAAQAYSPEAVSVLIDAGAAVDVKDIYGNTPLWRAVFNCKDHGGSVIALLRSAGADATIKNENDVSPLSLARNIGNFNVAQYFSDLSGMTSEDT